MDTMERGLLMLNLVMDMVMATDMVMDTDMDMDEAIGDSSWFSIQSRVQRSEKISNLILEIKLLLINRIPSYEIKKIDEVFQ